jgi:hypothetical protein
MRRATPDSWRQRYPLHLSILSPTSCLSFNINEWIISIRPAAGTPPSSSSKPDTIDQAEVGSGAIVILNFHHAGKRERNKKSMGTGIVQGD